MVFKHDNFVLDLTSSNKAKLYKDGKLAFLGDGYKAITMLIASTENPEPVKDKFKAQLEMREKPKFKNNDLEALRKEALLEEEARKLQMLKKPLSKRAEKKAHDRRLI